MANYSRVLLSGSVDGKPIPVAAVATPGTLIHTAVAGQSPSEEIYLMVSNLTGVAVPLTIEWGGVADPGDLLVKAVSIPPNSGPIPIAPGLPIRNGLVIRAFAGTANALTISGWANRIQ